MHAAKHVEEAILTAMVQLASGTASWAQARDAFNEKFLVHGDTFCSLNRQLGETMAKYRAEALGDMWRLCEQDISMDVPPSDPARMQLLHRMEQVVCVFY